MALTCDIVAAHVSSNVVAVGEVLYLIDEVYRALAGLGSAPVAPEKREPAVSIRSSIRNDHIICLEDGKKMKLLKFHLMSGHGLTPAEYRARWGLEPDYPMDVKTPTALRPHPASLACLR